MIRRCAAIAIAAVIGSMLLVASPASAAPTPVVTVSQELDLVDGQSVTVSGTGYPAGSPVFIGECTFGTVPQVCGPFVFGGFISGAGTFSSAYTIDATPGTTSCMTNACIVVATTGSVANGALLWFRNAAGTTGHLAATSPSTDLVDGQSVTISGTEWNTGWVEVRQCMTVAADGSAVCTAPTGVTTLADVNGVFSTSFAVHSAFDGQLFTPTGTGGTQHIDCAQPQVSGCYTFVSQGTAWSAGWRFRLMPIAFERVAASKDDCKNGGWATVVDSNHQHFRNQGDCVSFVATGGRNTAR